MRTFYNETRAEKARAKGPSIVPRLIRWATALFAVACLWIDARLVLAGAGDDGLYAVLLRSVLLEVEAYLAIVAVLMTLRISGEVSERDPLKRKRRPA